MSDRDSIIMEWSDDEQDIICHAPNRQDMALMFNCICNERASLNPAKVFLKSLVDELIERGYDIATLKFSIKANI